MHSYCKSPGQADILIGASIIKNNAILRSKHPETIHEYDYKTTTLSIATKIV